MSRQILFHFGLCNLTVEYTTLPIINALSWKCTKLKTDASIIYTISTYIQSLLMMMWICYYMQSTQSRKKLMRWIGSWLYAFFYSYCWIVNYPQNQTFFSKELSCSQDPHMWLSTISRAANYHKRLPVHLVQRCTEHHVFGNSLGAGEVNTNTGEVPLGWTEPYTIKQRKHSL